MRKHNHSHSHHLGFAGIAGLAAGAVLMLYVPKLKIVSGAIVLFSGFHLIGALMIAASAYGLSGHRFKPSENAFDFGWSPAWLLSPWIAALILASIGLIVPWPLLSVFLALNAAAFCAGGVLARSSTHYDYAVLPMVDLCRAARPVILDAGCGAGRTTVAVGRAIPEAQVFSLDRFDAAYIEDGGRALLQRNLKLAGMAARVTIQSGDMTAMPFAAGSFDAAVSAHALDHVGPQIDSGLRDILRVLKPGGRFLLIAAVPGWALFSMASALSLFATSKQSWRNRATAAGFRIHDEGMFNGFWFALLEKPEAQ